MCLFSCVLPSVSPPAIGLEISSCFPRPQMVYHSVPSLRALQVDISGAHDEAKPHESVKSKLEVIRYHHYPVLYRVYVFSARYAVKSHNFMLPVESICGALSRSPLVSLGVPDLIIYFLQHKNGAAILPKQQHNRDHDPVGFWHTRYTMVLWEDSTQLGTAELEGRCSIEEFGRTCKHLRDRTKER